jgi:uncharacterized protein (TIGR02453 family)
MGTQFSNEALKFLRGLKKNNDREWFGERKDVYEKQLKEPMLKLIGEVNEAMAEFSPEHLRPANKILMRIYRDIRFSKDKRPYKHHVSAWWARDGLQKTSGGGFYLQVSSTDVLIAAGVYAGARAAAGDSAIPGRSSSGVSQDYGGEEAAVADGGDRFSFADAAT